MSTILTDFYKSSRKALFGAAAAGVLAFKAEIVPYLEGTVGQAASAIAGSALTGVVIWFVRNDGDPSNDGEV